MTKEELQEIERRLESSRTTIGLWRFESMELQPADVDALVAEVRRLSLCSCGRALGRGLCGVCDNDE